MEEQFVPYNIALQLEELGFDEECLAYFNEVKPDVFYIDFFEDEDSLSSIKVPLWQQATDFLREKYELSVFIDMNCMENSGYAFYIGDLVSRETIFENYENIESYYEAREQAILKCIELCKNKKL